MRPSRVFGLLDLTSATLYLYVGFVLAPGRSLAFNVALLTVSALLAAAGLGLLFERRVGRLLALIASAMQLAFAAVVVLLLVASSAYLRGLYGPLGRGIAAASLAVAALVIEACALLPIFQLRFLLGSRRG